MVTTIQIDERTKALLDRLKVHYRQSYNEIIEKMARENLLKEKKDIMAFAGIWKNKSEKEIEEIKTNIGRMRKKSTKELFARVKRFDL